MSIKMTKQDKYEVNQRNGFFMWAYNSSINTVQHIQQVKEGKMWVPMYDEVKLRPCPKPPLKNFVLKAVENALLEKEEWRLQTISDLEQGNIVPNDELLKAIKRPFELNMTSSHQPDIEWLIVVLSTLQPNHRFFDKSYFPSDEELGGRGAKIKHNNDAEYDEFFEGLPEHLSKAKAGYSRAEPAYSKRNGFSEKQSQSGNDSQAPKNKVNQQNNDKQEIAELKRQIHQMQSQNQQNGFKNFYNQNNSNSQNGFNNQFMFQNQQSQSAVNAQLHCFGQVPQANSKTNEQFQNQRTQDNLMEHINDATFGQNKFNSVFASQNENFNMNNQQQTRKEIAINSMLNDNTNPKPGTGGSFAAQTKKIFPTIMSLNPNQNNVQFNPVRNGSKFVNQQTDEPQQNHSVSSKIYQTGSKFTKQFYAQEKTPWQANSGIQDQTTGYQENQSNSVQVTPTKLKMNKVQILFQDTADSNNLRQISQSEVKENQAPNIKSNFIMNNMIVQSANGDSSNQVDFHSLNRALDSYQQHLQQNQNQENLN